MVIEEEWFYNMNLTQGATFLMDLIISTKNRVNQKTVFQRDTNQHIREITISNGCNTQIVHILCEMCDGNFIFNGIFPSRLSKPFELTHYWINMKCWNIFASGISIPR